MITPINLGDSSWGSYSLKLRISTNDLQISPLELMKFARWSHSGTPRPPPWSHTSHGWIRSMSWDALRMASTEPPDAPGRAMFHSYLGPNFYHVSFVVVGPLVLPFVLCYTRKNHLKTRMFRIILVSCGSCIGVQTHLAIVFLRPKRIPSQVNQSVYAKLRGLELCGELPE